MTKGDIQIVLAALSRYNTENFVGERLQYANALADDLSRNIESFEAKINEVEDLYSNRKLWDILKHVCSEQGWNFKRFLKQVYDNYYSKDELYNLMSAETGHTLPDGRFHDFLWFYLIPKARQYITEIKPKLQQLEENYDNAKSDLKDAKDKEEAFFTGEI